MKNGKNVQGDSSQKEAFKPMTAAVVLPSA